jgi:hypothetical protein
VRSASIPRNGLTDTLAGNVLPIRLNSYNPRLHRLLRANNSRPRMLKVLVCDPLNAIEA